ncbi:hypothetical protein Afil01_07830 [Actinorhabdospora filicis]|uniref:Exo-alpha-sialidase n=1 Tax=Actinorhabdospora filicis TaxID=1785913 RepID=A0A9W6SI76_9ACTN|nr:hypothetical protein [Actinorhabdospora filicis]GLZ75976.1 hypothetical protein Afil01_07830 [Actinorhabdospora filicis]
MRYIKTGAATAAAATLALIGLATNPAAAAPSWHDPSCASVSGPGAITFSKDDGATLAPATRPGPVVYTNGLAALETPDTLVAVQEVTAWPGGGTTVTVHRSTDAGCSWSPVATLPSGQNVRATAAGGSRAYLWSDSPVRGLYRLDGTTVTTLTDPTPAGATGLTADPYDPDHVVIGDNAGRLYETWDGGAVWGTLGGNAGGIGVHSGYDTTVDPGDLAHAVVGASGAAYVTFDGGVNWTRSAGLDLTPGGRFGVNVFSVAVSPVDGDVVYAAALDIDQNDAHDPTDGRHIYRSTDGGRTFAPIADQGGDITIYNGPNLFPSPVDAGTLYFEFGSNYAGTGTFVYKYSATTGVVTFTHNDYHGLGALAFNPANPATLYLGLAVEP